MKLRYLLATVISTIGNPMALGLFFGAFLYFSHSDSGEYEGLPMVFSGIVILPVLTFTTIKVKKGEFEDYDVSDRLKRTQLYKFVLFVFLILNIFLIAGSYPVKAILVSGILFIHLLISFLVNQRLKVSMHTSFSFLFSALFVPLSHQVAVGLFVFGFVNAWSRIVLGRHKTDEVIAGWILGMITGGIYIFLFQRFIPSVV